MLAMLPIVLTACLEEDNYEQRPNQTDKIQLTISLPEQTRIATNTRAVSNRVDYSIVNNLNIVLASGIKGISRSEEKTEISTKLLKYMQLLIITILSR